MASGHETHSAHDLQHGHLGLDVLSGQALGDDVDALRVRQHMGTALRVVHQCLDAADERGVDLRLRRLVVHRLQEVQDARQTVQIDEPRHKPKGQRNETWESNQRLLILDCCV